MSRKSRSQGKNESIRFQFRLNPEQDQDLIEWLNDKRVRERSVFVRDALRKGIAGDKVKTDSAPIASANAPKIIQSMEIINKEDSSSKTNKENNAEDKLEKLTRMF